LAYKSYRVQISSIAKRDATQYAAYVSQVKLEPQAARKWLDELLAEISTLVKNPNRFAVINEAKELNFPYRAFNFHSHRVVYAVLETEKRVIVHRIWHGARALSRIDKDS
jgi:plasmid stabilization system protein ParE